MKYYYGYITDRLIVEMVDVVLLALDKAIIDKTRRLMLGTLAHETLLGRINDTTLSVGMGLAQFDRIAYDDVMLNGTKHFAMVKETLGIDLKLTKYEDLRYNPFLSIIFMRLKYKRVPEAIPNDMEGIYIYYKKYYNSSEGKASKEAFMEHYKLIDDILYK